MTSFILISAAALTAALSATLGMVGGAVLLWVCLLLLPVAPAMVLHGLTQAVSNGSRALLLWRHVRLGVLLPYGVGAALAGLVVGFIAFVPDHAVVYILLGLVPWVGLLVGDRFHLDVVAPRVAFFAGFLTAGVQSLAGVAGPLLDMFFVHTTLTRHEVVATKAATQLVSHIVKVLAFLPAISGVGASESPLGMPLVFAMGLAALGGTRLGSILLNRFSDVGFRRAGTYAVRGLGLVYLWNGVHGLG